MTTIPRFIGRAVARALAFLIIVIPATLWNGGAILLLAAAVIWLVFGALPGVIAFAVVGGIFAIVWSFLILAAIYFEPFFRGFRGE